MAALVAPALAAPAPVAVEAFAAPPRLSAVSISPDGRYLAVITTAADRDTSADMQRFLDFALESRAFALSD